MNLEVKAISESVCCDFLLITPLRILPTPLVPTLGPLCLYSYAKKNGFTGELINFNEIINENNIGNHSEVVEKTLSVWFEKHSEVLCVGISVLFSGVFSRVLEIATISKKIRSDVKIIVGGIHPTLHAWDILEQCPQIDYVVMGEGEIQFVGILKYLSGKDGVVESMINGIGYRKGKQFFINKKTEYTNRDNIHDLGCIDYSLIDFKRYHTSDMELWYNPKKHKIISAAPIVTSRSCPFRCNFCSIHAVHGPNNTFRYRSSDDVVEELKYLYYEKEIRYFYIVDDCATGNKNNTMELYSKIVKSGMNISIEFQNGVNISSLDDEIIDVLSAAGMVRGGLAIESGSELIRNQIIGKKLSYKKILSVYRHFRNNHKHIWLLGFFIIGLPEETYETLDETIKLVEELDEIYPIFNVAVPTPGTRLWEQCVRDDLLLFDNSNVWKKSFIFGVGNRTQKEELNYWTMHGLDSILDIFVIKPYKLDFVTLSRYYERLQKLRNERLQKIKSMLCEI
ncbi:MAG: B12-binding domain-containing radical SAM protein [Oligoflexales bacterium]|nr:B12-binding domain-containing radical SAM protein [Oligoflexales bacterium]